MTFSKLYSIVQSGILNYPIICCSLWLHCVLSKFMLEFHTDCGIKGRGMETWWHLSHDSISDAQRGLNIGLASFHCSSAQWGHRVQGCNPRDRALVGNKPTDVDLWLSSIQISKEKKDICTAHFIHHIKVLDQVDEVSWFHVSWGKTKWESEK